MRSLNYRQAGVNIDQADEFIRRIKPLVKQTNRPEVMGGLGGFSGLFAPRLKNFKDPVLVSSTDGVGTKLLIAERMRRYDTVGLDLVAMCVDDVVVLGAEPLFFLDYIAIGRVQPAMLVSLMKGIANGCRQAGCSLLGGETAELPGMYEAGKFDLAGFCVGLVSREKIIDGRSCRRGDVVLGLASSGLHSNGYSLVRKVFPPGEVKGKLGLELLKPTRIYAKTLLKLITKVRVKGMAHITGGGFYDNIPRVIPDGLQARIKQGSWRIPPIFGLIQKRGRVAEREMYRTFNMGIGMVAMVGPDDAARALKHLAKLGQKAWVIGELVKGPRGVVLT